MAKHGADWHDTLYNNGALCPAVGIDTIALLAAQALAWTWRNAARFAGHPARTVVVGHLARGHLAAMLQSCRWQAVAADLPAPLLPAALSLSGLCDLAAVAAHAIPAGRPAARRRISAASAQCLSLAFFPHRACRHALRWLRQRGD